MNEARLTMVDSEQDLREQWARWQRAIEDRDVEAAARCLDDDFALELIQPVRAQMGRAQWLATLPDYVVSRYEVEDQIVDIDGHVGVVLHRARMQATVAGVDRSGIFVITDVWRRDGRRWKVWRRHSTPLTSGAMPSAGR